MSTSPSPGWYLQQDGARAYWTGSEWITPGSQSVVLAEIKHRRNNVPSGILVLLGAFLLIAASQLQWLILSGPDLTLNLKEYVQVGIHPQMSDESLSGITRSVLFGSGVGIAALSIALILTRFRGLGLAWRILIWPPVILLSWAFYEYWKTANSGISDALVDESDSLANKAVGIADAAAQNLGLYDLSPGVGLYVWFAGLVIIAIGLVLPATKSRIQG